MRRWLTALVPTAAALGLLVPLASPAQAAPPDSELVLLWSRYNGVDEPHHIATLSCFPDPATGQHPDPVAACAALDAVDGQPSMLPDDARECTDEFDPVGILVIGTWGGAEVFYTEDFGNPCEAARGTAGVFDYA